MQIFITLAALFDLFDCANCWKWSSPIH